MQQRLSMMLATSWSFLRPKKKLGLISIIVLLSFFVAAWFIFTPVTHALLSEIGAGIRDMFTELFLALAGFFIKLTFFVLKFIIEVAGYNGYIDSPAVTVGWVMVRDLTNMFFIVVLLIISFGTILGLEKYEYKQLLVKLLIAAVVVNFSRVICGAIIDLGQIIMVTFINGIAATASGNLVNMFNVDDIFKLGSGADVVAPDANATFIASVAALVFGIMMLVTMATFLLLLMARMAMLWVLIVLSPLAFVLNVLPQTEKYASDWWSQFGSNVVSGPIVVFFLWLSFVTVGTGTAHDQIKKHNSLPAETLSNESEAPKEEQTGITSIMSWTKMANFVIAIAMLLAGAKMAQELGVIGGDMMGAAKDVGKKVAMYASGINAARWGAGKAAEGAKAVGKFAAMKAPIIGGDEWVRRWRRTKAAASKLYTKHWVEPRLLKAGENINEAYGKEDVDIRNESEHAQDLVAERNKALAASKNLSLSKEEREANEKKAEEATKKLEAAGYDVDTKNGKTTLKKAFAPTTRLWARMKLWGAPAAFKEEYTKDTEKGAELAHEQLEHLVSTSKTPIGKFKTEAEARLRMLEETGGEIKAEKIESVNLRLAETAKKIAKIVEEAKKAARAAGGTAVEQAAAAEGALADAVARGQFSESDLFNYRRQNRGAQGGQKAEVIKHALAAEESLRKAKEKEKILKGDLGHRLEHETAEHKAESKKIEDKLKAEEEIGELRAIRKLLEADPKSKTTEAKAIAEQMKLDIDELQALQLARARDAELISKNRYSEANNEQNTINDQIEARIKKHSAGSDYVQSDAKTRAQIDRIRKQQGIVNATADAEQRKIEEAKLGVLKKSLSEMVISNVGTHAAVADGLKGQILKAAGMNAAQSMESNEQAIRNLQAQDLAELIGEKVGRVDNMGNDVPLEQRDLEAAITKLKQRFGDKAMAMLEQKRLKNEKAAGEGSLGRAGLYKVVANADGVLETQIIDASDADDRKHVESRRTAGLSGSKITNVKGFKGSLDVNFAGKATLESAGAQEIFLNLAGGLTSNNLGSVDEYTKSDLAEAFENTSPANLQAVLAKLGSVVKDERARKGLLNYALQKMNPAHPNYAAVQAASA